MVMPSSNLGRTGLVVSRLGLGTMTFGLQTEEDAAHRILDRAVSGGINFIDTANVYPLGGGIEMAGGTEEIIGRWLRGRRHEVILATKGAGVMGSSPWERGSSRKHLLDAIDASLRRLGTDHVDLYQLHLDDPSTPLDETLGALETIVASGRARYVGVSNFAAYRLALALYKADARGYARPVSVQPRYNLLFRDIERELLPLAREEGLGVIVYNPLAGGLLTGKHAGQKAPPEGSRFTLGTAGARYQRRYWDDGAFDTVEQIVALARDAGVTPGTLAISWVLANPTVTLSLLGASRPEQLDDTLRASAYRLDAGLKDRLDALTDSYRSGRPDL